MMPPTIVLVVQDQSVLELRFRLPERALGEIKVGDPITAKFDAMGVTRQAKVARIQPSVDARTRTVEVIAELNNADGGLRSGLLAEVTLGDGGDGADGGDKAQQPAPAPGAETPRAGRPAPKAENKAR
jgi:multidrug efflux pump subunit AcrA (membrane-fusion protein)